MTFLSDQVSPYSRELTALLVEDDAASRRLLSAQLKGLFRELLLAEDGQQGLELFRTRSPQLVLTDNVMPALSGIAMTEAIRELDPRVPILFITASMDRALMVHAINLGISAFIPKPVVLDSLGKALALAVGMLETRQLQRKNTEQELALLHFREKYHEHQQEIAFRKELSILENDYRTRSFPGAPDPARGEWVVQASYQPHDIMCGDSYSLRRLPDGSQLVFLADAMGKGLAAALTTTLCVHTFNLLVDTLGQAVPAAPFQFPDFVRHFITLMRKRLLEDEVLPLCLAWLPAAGAVMETAAFGMPPILVGGPEGCASLRCNNPPLSPFLEEPRTTRHDLGAARAVLLYTDGLNEAVTLDGDLYRRHLGPDFQASASLAQLLEAFSAKVTAPEDDVTLLRLFRIDGAPLWREDLLVRSRLDSLEQASQAVERCLADCHGLGPGERGEFAMAVREGLLNAYEHGSLAISTGDKHRLLDEGLYFEHLLELEQSVGALITVAVALQAEGGNRLLKVTVTDEGPGFTRPAAENQQDDSMLLHGRGLKLIRKYSDAYFFNEMGNTITLLKIYRGVRDAVDAHQPQPDHHYRQHQEHGRLPGDPHPGQ